MRSRFTRLGCVLLVFGVVLTGCNAPSREPARGGSASDGGVRLPEGTSVTHDAVAYTDNAVVIDAAAVRSGLRGQDGRTYRFATGTPGIDRLVPGSVALLGGEAVRKVTGVRSAGGEIVVDTTDARLNELVTDGTIGWRAPVRWGSIPRASYRKAALSQGLHARYAPARWEEEPSSAGKMTFAGTMEGFEVKLELEPKDDKLEFEMEAKRLNVRVTAKGSMSNFVQEARMAFDHGKGSLVKADLIGIRGDAEVTWAAVGHGSAGLDEEVVRISLPFEAPIPIVVGGIPFTLKIKSAVRIVPVLRENSSSGGSFKVTYDSDQGFTTGLAGGPGVHSTVRSVDAQIGSKEAVTAGYLPVGFAWGWEFPRFELAVAGIGTFAAVSFDTYMDGQFTPGTTLTADVPPCQRTSVRLHVIGLFKLDLLGGLPTVEGQRTLWEKKFDRYKDDKPCTMSGK